ncbi:MAG: helix-turn-helix domain-containing protein [Nitrosospira sp.]
MQTQLLNTIQAARYLGLSKAFLERDRWAGARVPFIKIGSRAVRYRLQDLEQYIESCMRKSTSDTGRK